MPTLTNSLLILDNLGGSLTKLAYYSTVKFKINKVVKDEKELYDVSETEKLTPRCGVHSLILTYFLDSFLVEHLEHEKGENLSFILSLNLIMELLSKRRKYRFFTEKKLLCLTDKSS